MPKAAKIFGAGVTSIQKDVPLIPLEVRKDDQGIAFTLQIRRLPRLESQKCWAKIQKAEEQVGQIDDPEVTCDRLMAAVQCLTRPRGDKKKPRVIESMTGLTLANFEAMVNDHQDVSVFAEMREDPTKEFPHFVEVEDDRHPGKTESLPTILEYVLAQNPSVRMAVLLKLSEAVEEEAVKQEGKESASESSSA